MRLFHATESEMEIGAVIVAAPRSPAYPEASAEIDKRKPGNLPSRGQCLFAAETADHAAMFGHAQRLQNFYVYEVEMPAPHKAPFAITHAVSKRLAEDRPIDQLAAEYWSPRMTWNFYEYLDTQMHVLGKIEPTPSSSWLLTIKYDNDTMQVDRM